MHRIIGGEFAIDSRLLSKNEKRIELQYSSGRSALYSILMHIKAKSRKILLPSYLCDSITRTVIDAGWMYEFYQVDECLHPVMDDVFSYRIKLCDAVLLIDYFGITDVKGCIFSIREKNKNVFIIEDDVQAFYSMNESLADCSFTSLRKWFPCPDGAILHANISTNIEACIKLENKWSQYKLAGNLLKEQSDYIDDSIMLSLLDKGEELLDDGYLSPCSEASRRIFANLDLGCIAQQRKRNAYILHCELEKLGIRHLYSDNKVPLFISIFVKNRDELRRAFFAEQIFVPKHWPRMNDKLNGTNPLYDTELSLICDQRYDEEDMFKQIGVIKNFLKMG